MNDMIIDRATDMAVYAGSAAAKGELVGRVVEPVVSIRPGSLADGTVRVARAGYARSTAVIASNPRTAAALAVVAVAGAAYANRRKLHRALSSAASAVIAPISNALDHTRQAIHLATASSVVTTAIDLSNMPSEFDIPAVHRRGPAPAYANGHDMADAIA